ncbi:tetratricopeptide repeat protein [Bacillus aquiflavi]|uniref:Tetratricopeptide repeat protein n=1 Tax=Bacillus aquiflavi TaxID=2672567 RepID=A0A6B3VQY6_9BACI|nr:tetratricopeptide repeat protein [Bacillus aquiflavi]MBA4536332.1 tetratricopeptide repeat protein [Bacillus aquiflavi]NEY80700.1 tetratricopeptide repeat protein [Bacillus aquiflavi]UAC48834.1 tetratricopeptide repeat protein [Bacillus aquiflavi]
MNIVDFKKKLPVLNEIIFFDKNQYLREKCSNPFILEQLINAGETLLEELTDNEEDKYFLCGVLGHLYRVYGQPKKAIYYLTLCLKQAIREGNISKEVVSLIRYGEALKYDHKHREALKIFNKALDKCKENALHSYVDFALQHKGKCLLELTKIDEAENCFLEAFKIRKLKANGSLLDSTQQAIDFVKSMRDS